MKIHAFAAAALSATLVACSSTPDVKEWASKLNPFSGEQSATAKPSPAAAAAPVQKGPIRTQMGVYMPRKDYTKNTFVGGGGYSGYWYEEGRIVRDTALRSLGGVFQEVAFSKDERPPHPVTKIRFKSSYNPINEIYFASATVTIHASGGELLGSFEAEGSSTTGKGEAGFQKAYDEAFAKVVAQIKGSAAVVTALQGESAAPAAAATPGAASPTSPAGAPAPASGAAAAAPGTRAAPAGQAPAAAPAAKGESAFARSKDSAAPTGRSAFVPPPGPVALPLPVSVAVYVPPEKLNRQARAGAGGYGGFWYDDGKFLQQAAMDAFGKVFAKAEITDNKHPRSVVARLDSSSAFNPGVGSYHAEVRATFASATGETLGEFEGKGSAGSINSDDGFRKAYAQAFQALREQMLGDGAFIAAVQSPAASTPRTAAEGKPGEITLPSKGVLGVYMDPDDLKKSSHVLLGYGNYWFQEGQMIQATALKSFGRLFAKVSPSETDVAETPIASIKGHSIVNPLMGDAYATVVVTFYKGGDPIARYTGEAKADGTSEAAFQKAYNGAFESVVGQMLKAGRL